MNFLVKNKANAPTYASRQIAPKQMTQGATVLGALNDQSGTNHVLNTPKCHFI